MVENPEPLNEDLVLVREIMAHELETVNAYYALLQRAQNEKIRFFIEHVMNEEKEHIAESLHLLREFDSVQAIALETGHAPDDRLLEIAPDAETQAMAREPAETPSPAARETGSPQSVWSVGSLLGRPQE